MNLNVSILDIIIFLGVVQGIAALVLLLLHRNTLVSRAFCLLLASFVLINLKIQLRTLHIWEHPKFNYFPLAIDLLIQPAFYIYIIAITRPGFTFKKKYYLHFLPCALLMLHALIVYFSVWSTDSLAAKTIIAEQLHYKAVKYVEDYLSVLSAFIYGFVCFRVLRQQLTSGAVQKTAKTKTKLNWLKSLLVLFLLLALMLAVNIILEDILKVGNRTFVHWTIFYTYLSGFLYYLGITSIQYPEMITGFPVLSSKKVDDDKSAGIAARLKEMVENEKLYKISDLTIQDLAKKMNISVSNLSYVINTSFKSNYRDFMNDYKINDVKDILLNNKYENLSMLGIATEAGFSSEATFYRAFKNKVGMSPREFREKFGKNKS